MEREIATDRATVWKSRLNVRARARSHNGSAASREHCKEKGLSVKEISGQIHVCESRLIGKEICARKREGKSGQG